MTETTSTWPSGEGPNRGDVTPGGEGSTLRCLRRDLAEAMADAQAAAWGPLSTARAAGTSPVVPVEVLGRLVERLGDVDRVLAQLDRGSSAMRAAS